jgi:hypothetical protein
MVKKAEKPTVKKGVAKRKAKEATKAELSTHAKDILRLKEIHEKFGAQLEEADDILRSYPAARRESRGWIMRVYGCMGHFAKLGDMDLEVFSPRVTMEDTIEQVQAESQA